MTAISQQGHAIGTVPYQKIEVITTDQPTAQRIIVPLDGSGLAEQAIPHAAEIARQSDAELILVYIFKPGNAAHVRDVATVSTVTAVNQARDEAERYIKSCCNKLKRQKLNARGYWVEATDATAVTRAAASEKADLIVMAAQRNWLERLLIGDPVAEIQKRTEARVVVV